MRIRDFKLRLLCLGLLLAGTLGLAIAQDDPSGEGDEIPASDSLALDSLALDSLLQDSLASLAPLRRQGPLLTDLTRSASRRWICGDSGLVAWSAGDSLWNRLPGADSLIGLNAIAFSGRTVVVGDSGRVYIVQRDSLRRVELDSAGSIAALRFNGGEGWLAGEKGLLARSMDGGRSWTRQAPPVKARFLALEFHEGDWYLAGTGGFLFRSRTAGSWERIPRRSYSDLVALRSDPRGLLVLAEDGWLQRLEPDGSWTTLNEPGWGEAWCLERWTGGWLIGGSEGRIKVFHEGLAAEDTLDRTLLFTSALAEPGRVLLSGSRGVLAAWSLADAELVEIGNSLGALSESPEEELPADSLEVPADSLRIDLVAQVSADTSRYLFSYLDLPPGFADNQGKVDRLLRNYNRSRFLEQPGFVVMALDIGPRGRLERSLVLDEYPVGLGLKDYAIEVVNSLNYSPGSLAEELVPGRLLFSLHFPVFRSNLDPWYANGADGDPFLDSLMGDRQRITSALDPKKLVKRLSFPRKAKRFHWAGETLLRVAIDSSGALVEQEVLLEDPEGYDFAEHALEQLPELALQAGGVPGAGWIQRGYLQLRFDRKRYKKARKEVEKGFAFVEDRYSWVLRDTASYRTDLLAGVCQAFFKENQPVGEAELSLVLGHDGLPVYTQLAPADTSFGAEAVETIEILAQLLTWGYPSDLERGDHSDTLRVPLVFPLSAPDSTAIDALLEGVRF